MVNTELDCVFIETTTVCTRKCLWCTHHYYNIQPTKMPEELFIKIITELSDISFNGRLSYYLNGEPLTDTRLAKLISIGKEKCPNAFSFLISNGDLATQEKLMELFVAGLDALKINTYDEDTFKRVSLTLENIPDQFRQHILLIDLSKKTDWTSRGGTVPFGTDIKPPKGGVCLRPFRQMYITTQGFVAQCCSDALNKYIMGDLNTQSLQEVWHGDAFQRVREGLLGMQGLNNLCKICNLERYYDSAQHLRKLFKLNTKDAI